MAGKHGGGAWKVAYADFVTAMMAFFLVMWICSQDQKIKRAVADYFGDPWAAKRGTAGTPYRVGAVFEGLATGTVPEAQAVALGRGRDSHSTRRDQSLVTKVVSDWLHADPQVSQRWREEARKQRDAARAARPDGDSRTVEQAATLELSRLLKDEVMSGIPPQTSGLYRDLLFEILSDVNWTEIAEDLLAH